MNGNNNAILTTGYHMTKTSTPKKHLHKNSITFSLPDCPLILVIGVSVNGACVVTGLELWLDLERGGNLVLAGRRSSAIVASNGTADAAWVWAASCWSCRALNLKLITFFLVKKLICKLYTSSSKFYIICFHFIVDNRILLFSPFLLK